MFTIHALSLPCLHTFWHAIPTSFYIFNVFLSLVIKLVKMSPGGMLHVVVGTLKISLDRLKKKKKKHKKEFCRVL